MNPPPLFKHAEKEANLMRGSSGGVIFRSWVGPFKPMTCREMLGFSHPAWGETGQRREQGASRPGAAAGARGTPSGTSGTLEPRLGWQVVRGQRGPTSSSPGVLHPLLTPEPCLMAQQGNTEPIRSLVGGGEQERMPALWQEGQPLPPLPGTGQQVGTDMAFPPQQDWGSD